MATLTNLSAPDAPPVRQSITCERCGVNPAVHTLVHWEKLAGDVRAARRKGESGAVYAAHLCLACSETYHAGIADENKAAHDRALDEARQAKGDEPLTDAEHLDIAVTAPPHGGFTIFPLPEAP